MRMNVKEIFSQLKTWEKDISCTKKEVETPIYYFPRASITEYQRSGGLNNKLIFLQLWRLKPKIKVLAEFFSSETSLLGL